MGREGSRRLGLSSHLGSKLSDMQFQKLQEAGVLSPLEHHGFWNIGWLLTTTYLSRG